MVAVITHPIKEVNLIVGDYSFTFGKQYCHPLLLQLQCVKSRYNFIEDAFIVLCVSLPPKAISIIYHGKS